MSGNFDVCDSYNLVGSMFEGQDVWGFWCIRVSVYLTIYRETWGLGGMIVSYVLERF